MWEICVIDKVIEMLLDKGIYTKGNRVITTLPREDKGALV